MELVSVIYNSLLVVFVLLVFVIVISLISSKILLHNKPTKMRNKAKHSKVKTNKLSQTEPSVKSEFKKKEVKGLRESQTKIDRKLIDNKKVKIVSRAEKRKKENAINFAFNNASRYSVVNNAPQVRKSREDLYHKFSKMSVEYSQST
ncbi:MAG: hypothetical protein L3J41_14140 [Melioribacteraceae bacterium]|nr:hypothetical protein [Melioribacteraceae bacterium]